ncbi:hypothetical protein ILYODFUR_002307 [Ilyodon furcidens]|uniref:Interleukin-1 beta n=1 Tax=Ilyodon furcidens TaxID=33524 RepID=A0ABV0STS2_9TELE
MENIHVCQTHKVCVDEGNLQVSLGPPVEKPTRPKRQEKTSGGLREISFSANLNKRSLLNLIRIIYIYFKDLSCQTGPDSSFLFTTIFVTEDIDHVETLELNITRMDAPILSECINSLKQFRTLI